MSVWGKAAGGWQAFARGFGRVQTTIILSILYFLLLGTAFLVHFVIRQDPLARGSPADGGWRPREGPTADLENVARRF